MICNIIRNWNDLVYRGQWREAFEWLESTNSFPEITGRVCPAICEAACTLAANASPVAIRHIELSVIERVFEKGWVVPRPPVVHTDKEVAAVGSGPSGLAAAQALRRLGHSVVVFEKSDNVGGILRYGIPDFKLEKWILDRRVKQLKEEGIRFTTRVNVGEDISARELTVLARQSAKEPRKCTSLKSCRSRALGKMPLIPSGRTGPRS